MTAIVLQVAADGGRWVAEVWWACALFYVPWRTYAVAEARLRSAVRRRRTAVDR